jgi:hypothetical protein
VRGWLRELKRQGMSFANKQNDYRGFSRMSADTSYWAFFDRR